MLKKEEQKQSKDTVLESLYSDIQIPTEIQSEYASSNPLDFHYDQDGSDEGKLKLFVGGLYFQSECFFTLIRIF